MQPSLLLLADGRFPAGGHAYAAGVEAAVGVGDIVDVGTCERYLAGRLATTGVVDAAFAAQTCARLARSGDPLAFAAVLDAEYAARTPSPYLRTASRRFGRQLARAAGAIWPSASLAAVGATPGGAHQPIALGAVVGAAGGGAHDAAAMAMHHLAGAVTTAAVRLLGLDPVELAAVQARAGELAGELIAPWPTWAAAAPAELPATGGLLTEILGEHHGARDARLFVA